MMPSHHFQQKQARNRTALSELCALVAGGGVGGSRPQPAECKAAEAGDAAVGGKISKMFMYMCELGKDPRGSLAPLSEVKKKPNTNQTFSAHQHLVTSRTLIAWHPLNGGAAPIWVISSLARLRLRFMLTCALEQQRCYWPSM